MIKNIDKILISPNYSISDWVQAERDSNWERMTTIFSDRLDGRYLKPIRLIASDQKIGSFSGFSIIALDCLVIETLAQFYNGTDETTGAHWLAFWSVFKKSNFFTEFTKEKTRIFYSHFRCGILHQAQTKKMSLVKINREKMLEPISNKISEGMIVDRIKFHEALENEIVSYVDKLIDGEQELRKNFVKKINFICGL